MTALEYVERPAAGDPDGLLVLHHGRGTDERDLIGLADVLDPECRLHVAAPRAPLRMPGWPGYHWYVVPRVGHPDPDSWRSSVALLSDFHDGLWERTGLGPERTVLGGFSMGTVMSYSLGLSGDRPVPAGILALSGFVPTVAGWEPALEDRRRVRAFIAHGRRDQVIGVEFARRARELLSASGIEAEYHESDAVHQIDPAHIPAAMRWLAGVVSLAGGRNQ